MNFEMHQAGHLTALGWTSFALYILAALLSFRAAALVHCQRSAVRSPQSSETSRVWLCAGIILAALGLNKPLDMQTRLINLGRRIAGAENLSTHRTELHALFFLGFILLFLALLSLVLFRSRAQIGHYCRQLPLAAGGCLLICAYIVIRSVSITRVDLMLGISLERVRILWLLEAGGLLLIIVQAICQNSEKLKN